MLAEADELRGVRHVAKTGGTVGEWAQRWLAEGEHRLRASTVAGYRSKWKELVAPTWADTAIKDVTPAGVRRWVRQLEEAELAPATVRQSAVVLRLVLGTAVAHDAIAVNPVSGLRLGAARRIEPRFLTVLEVEALAEAISHPAFKVAGNGARVAARSERPDLALMVRLAAYCGLRAGELVGLRWRRVDLEGRTLHVVETVTDVQGHLVTGPTKSGKQRTVPLPGPVVDGLREHREQATRTGPEDWVFPNEGTTYGPLRQAYVYRQHFRPAAMRAGISPVPRWHDLRHTYASLLIAQGEHPRVVMELMGHSSIHVTLGTYGHLFPGATTEAIGRLGEQISAALNGTGMARGLRPESKNGL